MVFSIFKSFTSFLFFLVLIQKPILFWFLFIFHHEQSHPFFHFFFHVLFILLKTKKNLRFLSSQRTVTLPSQALPENRLGIAHAITEIGKDILIILNTFVEWSKHLRLILNLISFYWIYFVCKLYSIIQHLSRLIS